MAIPDFQTIMLPLLNYASDEKEHTLRDTYEFLADYFKLTQEERQTLNSYGNQKVFIIEFVGQKHTYLRLVY